MHKNEFGTEGMFIPPSWKREIPPTDKNIFKSFIPFVSAMMHDDVTLYEKKDENDTKTKEEIEKMEEEEKKNIEELEKQLKEHEQRLADLKEQKHNLFLLLKLVIAADEKKKAKEEQAKLELLQQQQQQQQELEKLAQQQQAQMIPPQIIPPMGEQKMEPLPTEIEPPLHHDIPRKYSRGGWRGRSWRDPRDSMRGYQSPPPGRMPYPPSRDGNYPPSNRDANYPMYNTYGRGYRQPPPPHPEGIPPQMPYPYRQGRGMGN